jgi:hypothetical protein
MTHGGKNFRKHLKTAKLLDASIRVVDVSKVDFFNHYAKDTVFSLDINGAIDVEFQCLAELIGWTETSFRFHWRNLLGEARCLVERTLHTSAYISLRGQLTTSPAFADVSVAQSVTSGVELYTPTPNGDGIGILSSMGLKTTTNSTTSTYFSGFSSYGFIPNPSINMSKEFRRLAKHMDCKTGSCEWNEQYSLTTQSELAACYGTVNKLESWQPGSSVLRTRYRSSTPRSKDAKL